MQMTDLNIGVLFVLASLASASTGRAGGLVVEQQIFAARRTAQLGADDQLRIADGAGDRRAAAAAEHAQLPRDRRTAQAGYYFGFLPRWTIFQGPFPQIIGFIMFIIAAFAETNRVPFDLPEAENELVAGFHTEYSSMKFAAFFMAEYANMVTVSCVATLLFLGGWHPLFPAPTVRISCPSLIVRRRRR